MFNLKENNTWTYIKLGDIITVKHGYAFKGSNFTSENTHKVVLTPGNFKIGGGFKSEKFKFTTEECPSEYVLQGGDIVVSMTDLSKYGDTLGYSALIPKDSRYKYLHNQRIGLIKFKKEDVSRDFIYWVLRTRDFNRFLVGSATGSTVKHTSPSIIGEYHFMIPNNRSEQDSISKILSDLDAKIELNQKMNKTLESIAEAIFKHWFIDFEFPNEDRKPYKSSGGEMVDSELGEIPKGWKIMNLDEIAYNLDSKRIPLSNREREARKGGFPYFGATGILDYVNDYLFDGVHVLMGEDGSVLSEDGHPILQYVWGKFWVNNHAHVLRGKIVSNELLYLFLRGTKVSHIVTGAVQQKINQKNMNKLKFLIPPNKTQSLIENFLAQIFEKIRLNFEQNKGLSQIRDFLLPKLMTGKIRVPLEEKENE